ncbi:MAG: glycosyl hydrolase family 28-related protein [Acetobacteraceae bacterium]|nr:glycosyl hydrolase family 28-related protein [Acetobacteraceae bacterium]
MRISLVLAGIGLMACVHASAQPVPTGGPLLIQNHLDELSAQGSSAQSTARINLGLGSLAVLSSLSGLDASASTALATSGTTARSFAARAADVANALDFGADPTGAADSSTAINAAIATGKAVYLPSGTYQVNNALTVGTTTASQRLYGDGWSTVLHVSNTFSSTASGVVVLSPNSVNNAQPAVENLRFLFDQPSDVVTTASAASASGNTTVTVASTSGISVGMVVYDVTTPAALPNAKDNNRLSIPHVASISGTTITLDNTISSGGVLSGDSLHFAASRAMAQTLAAGCTVGAGGTGCKYPPAIYASSANDVHIDHVMIAGAWDGVYLRGQTFHIGTLFVGALDVGLDVDNCYNFPQIDDYETWNFGFDDTGSSTSAASVLNYYDGNTVSANLGRTDGVSISSLQTWTGVVNITSDWTFGSIGRLMLDGNNADLNVTPGSGGGFLQIANVYSSKSAQTYGAPLYINAPSGFLFSIGDANLTSASAYNPAIVVAGGVVSITHGNFSDIQQSTKPFVSQTAGEVRLSGIRMAASGRTDTIISQTAGTLKINGLDFVSAAGTGGVGMSVTDTAANSIKGVYWNGFALSGLGTSPAGTYDGPSTSYMQSALSTSGLTTATATITGGTVNATPIGQTTPALGTFSTVTSTGQVTAVSGVTVISGSISVTNPGATALHIIGSDTSSVDMGAQIELTNTNASSSIQNKYMRVDSSGQLQFLNDAYSSILTLKDTGYVYFKAPATLLTYTVSALPTCNSSLVGAMAAVTDATSPTYNGTLTGGGSVSVPVYCNGTAWTAH